MEVALGVVGGLALAWLVLLAVLATVARRHGDGLRLRELLALLPQVVGLLRRLLADPTVPRGVRVRVLLLAGYLAQPVDLVPDVVPVLGWADDALAVVLVLRSVARRAGPEALERFWRGSPEGLALLLRAASVDRTAR